MRNGAIIHINVLVLQGFWSVGTILTMNNRSVRKGVILIARNAEDKYLLLRHKKNNLWGFISGGLEERETKVQAVIREAKEESGLSLDENMLNDTGKIINFISSKGPGQQTVFLCSLENPQITIDGEEISEYGWFTKEEALKNLEPKPPLIELFNKVVKD